MASKNLILPNAHLDLSQLTIRQNSSNSGRTIQLKRSTKLPLDSKREKNPLLNVIDLLALVDLAESVRLHGYVITPTRGKKYFTVLNEYFLKMNLGILGTVKKKRK